MTTVLKQVQLLVLASNQIPNQTPQPPMFGVTSLVNFKALQSLVSDGLAKLDDDTLQHLQFSLKGSPAGNCPFRNEFWTKVLHWTFLLLPKNL